MEALTFWVAGKNQCDLITRKVINRKGYKVARYKGFYYQIFGGARVPYRIVTTQEYFKLGKY